MALPILVDRNAEIHEAEAKPQMFRKREVSIRDVYIKDDVLYFELVCLGETAIIRANGQGTWIIRGQEVVFAKHGAGVVDTLAGSYSIIKRHFGFDSGRKGVSVSRHGNMLSMSQNITDFTGIDETWKTDILTRRARKTQHRDSLAPIWLLNTVRFYPDRIVQRVKDLAVGILIMKQQWSLFIEEEAKFDTQGVEIGGTGAEDAIVDALKIDELMLEELIVNPPKRQKNTDSCS